LPIALVIASVRRGRSGCARIVHLDDAVLVEQAD